MINVILVLGLYKVYVPSAIPAGWELSIGYFQVTGGAGIHDSLVPEGARLTCSSASPFFTG